MLFQEFQFNQYREECLSLSEPFHPARVLVQQKLCKLLEQKAEGEKKKRNCWYLQWLLKKPWEKLQ